MTNKEIVDENTRKRALELVELQNKLAKFMHTKLAAQLYTPVEGSQVTNACPCCKGTGLRNTRNANCELTKRVIYKPCVYCQTTRHAGSAVFCLNDHTPTCNYVLIREKCNCNGSLTNHSLAGTDRRF